MRSKLEVREIIGVNRIDERDEDNEGNVLEKVWVRIMNTEDELKGICTVRRKGL